MKTSKEDSKEEILKKNLTQMKIKTKSQMNTVSGGSGQTPKRPSRLCTVPNELRLALQDAKSCAKPESKKVVGSGQTPRRPSRMCTVPKDLRAALVDK